MPSAMYDPYDGSILHGDSFISKTELRALPSWHLLFGWPRSSQHFGGFGVGERKSHGEPAEDNANGNCNVNNPQVVYLEARF